MMLDRLASWAEHHEGSLPDNVIYYRDGVSSGHYKEVQSRELNAITEAYRLARLSRNKPEQTLNLTAVIVTKRHHTRFYPQTPAQGDKWGNNNTHTGTCVDTLVTSPYYQDFFLQSHSGIKGTAQPTRYFILKNSIPHMTPTTLRDLVSPLPPPPNTLLTNPRPTTSATHPPAPHPQSPTPHQPSTPTVSANAAACTSAASSPATTTPSNARFSSLELRKPLLRNWRARGCTATVPSRGALSS